MPFPRSAPPDNESLCICFYDRVRKSAWPCYPAKYWSIRMCDIQCDMTGSCSPTNITVHSNSDKHSKSGSSEKDQERNLIPCVCQNISNYCIATHKKNKNFTKLWEAMSTASTSTITTVTPMVTTAATAVPPFEVFCTVSNFFLNIYNPKI